MRRVASLLLVIVMLLLSGCWDRIEVNDLAIVTMAGVDATEAGVKLSVTVMVPRQSVSGAGGGSGSSGQAGTAVYSEEGETVMDALRRMQLKISRRLFWGHTRVLVLGAEYAAGGIRPAVDFWTRHREPRLLLRVVVAKGTAAEILQAQSKLEQQLAEAVRETLNLRRQTRSMLKDLVIDLRSGNPVLPGVVVQPDERGRDEVIISGTALLRQDRLIGWLDDRETRGLQWLLGDIDQSVVTVDTDGGKVSFQLVRAQATIRPEWQGNRLRMSVMATADALIFENGTGLDLGKAGTLENLRSMVERKVHDRIAEAVRKAQEEFRTDFLRMGDVVHVWAPQQWEGGLKRRWESEFPRVPVEIQVSIPVRGVGAHSKSLGER